MKPFFISLLISSLFLNACIQKCEKVISRYENDEIEVIYTFPNCSDSTKYERTFYYENGQKGSTGLVINNIKEGLYKSWNKKGVQAAEWNMKRGIEHGNVYCWYDNGVKSKETYLDNGKENGIERTWFENGKLASIGKYVFGERIGTWKYFDKNGTWKIRNYQDDELHGFTHEHIIDSSGTETIVIGQYEKGVETGIWKWFDKDSTLAHTAIFKDGKATGEIIEYYKNSSVKLKGNLIDGKYDNEVKHFDKNGILIKTEVYAKGELISTIDNKKR